MLKKSLLASVFLVTGAFVHFVTPHTDVVRAVGTEVKRMDDAGDNRGLTRDVYFILAETVEGGAPRVYQNQDTWLYLKKNSANTNTRAESLGDGKKLMAVRHYGWRIELLSMFPNATKIWAVEEAYTPIPFFRLIVLTIVWGSLAGLIFKFRSVAAARRSRRAELAANANASAARGARDRDTSSADVDAFLNDD